MRTLAALLLLALTSCMFSTPPPPIRTASGKPECVVSNAEPTAVLDRCAELLAADGWAPHSRTASELTMRQDRADGALDFYLTKEVWLIVTPRDDGAHVAGHVVAISRPGKANEQRLVVVHSQEWDGRGPLATGCGRLMPRGAGTILALRGAPHARTGWRPDRRGAEADPRLAERALEGHGLSGVQRNGLEPGIQTRTDRCVSAGGDARWSNLPSLHGGVHDLRPHLALQCHKDGAYRGLGFSAQGRRGAISAESPRCLRGSLRSADRNQRPGRPGRPGRICSTRTRGNAA